MLKLVQLDLLRDVISGLCQPSQAFLVFFCLFFCVVVYFPVNLLFVQFSVIGPRDREREREWERNAAAFDFERTNDK